MWPFANQDARGIILIGPSETIDRLRVFASVSLLILDGNLILHRLRDGKWL